MAFIGSIILSRRNRCDLFVVPARETRQDLLLCLLGVRNALPGLLPSLLQFRKLPHGWYLVASLLELVLSESLPFQNWRVNGVEDEVVLWTCEVEKTEAINVLLILGRHGYLIHELVDLEVPPLQSHQQD